MVRFTTQNIDRAARQIIVSGFVGEQWPGVGIGDETCRSVAVKRTLERAHQQIAFGSIVVDDAQSAITTVIFCPEILTHLGDVGDLTLDNKALIFLYPSQSDLFQVLNWQRVADTRFQLLPY